MEGHSSQGREREAHKGLTPLFKTLAKPYTVHIRTYLNKFIQDPKWPSDDLCTTCIYLGLGKDMKEA